MPAEASLRQQRNFAVAVFLVGLAALASLWVGAAPPDWLVVLALSALYAVFGSLSVTFPSGLTLTVGGPVLIATLLVFGPLAAAIIPIPAMIRRGLKIKQEIWRVGFNVGQLALAVVAASVAFGALGGEAGRFPLPAALVPMAAAAVVYDAVNRGLVTGILSLGREFRFTMLYVEHTVEFYRHFAYVYHPLGLVMALAYVGIGASGALLVSVLLLGLHSLMRQQVQLGYTRWLSVTDELTRAFNYRYFEELAEREASQQGERRTSSLLILDLDNFKELNDRHGHTVGNQVLAEVGRILRHITRNSDTVIRYGGEEFVIILPDSTKSEANAIAERIRQTVGTTEFGTVDRPLRTTVSIGLASLPADGRNLKEALSKADSAMYEAKRQGKDRVAAYRPDGTASPVPSVDFTPS